MRQRSTVLGSLVMGVLMTSISAGCGGSKLVGVQEVDTPSIPRMPTLMPGNASVTGHVLDVSGQGVAGATITVAETEATTSSDSEGSYELAVPSDSTLTLLTSAPGFATSHRESIVIADRSVVTGFDLLVLPSGTIATVNTLVAGNQAATRGLMAIRLHSLNASCLTTGARVSVWPPKVATVIYSRPGIAGGLDEPDVSVPAVQSGTRIGVWLAGVIPPGNMLRITVEQPGCHLLSQPPSMNGVLFSGLRRVDVQALTDADLFLE